MADEEESLVVIIPCLNEEATVEAAVSEVLAHASDLSMPVRILLIDDGSQDGTRAIMERIAALHDACDVVVNERNLGLGRSITRAYSLIPDDAWVTVFPGDGEFVFGPSIDSFCKVRHDYDVILGYLQNPVVRTLSRRAASQAFTWIAATIYGFNWRYLNGMKLYRSWALKGIEVESSGHAYMAELIAKAQLRRPGLRIGEAPFVSRGRAMGASKAFTLRSIMRAFWELVVGLRSVASFREEVIRGQNPLAGRLD